MLFLAHFATYSQIPWYLVVLSPWLLGQDKKVRQPFLSRLLDGSVGASVSFVLLLYIAKLSQAPAPAQLAGFS